MNDHWKKMIAPIVITVLVFVYLGFYVGLLMMVPESHPFVLLLTIPLIFLGAGMLYTLITRIREIRSGEEDDLGNY